MVSLYANYIEGLIQGATAPESTSSAPIVNAGEVFSPFKSKQYEVGAKYDQGTIGGTLALYRITEPSAYVIGNVFAEDGRQRNQGVEFSTYGQIVKGLRLLGGATVLDAKTTETDNALIFGKKVIGVPQTTASLGIEWDVTALRGLTVDGRVVYTSSEWVDGGNTESIPAWTRVDLGARYSLPVADKLLTVRANVENVANKDYWSSVGGAPGDNYLVLAAPRTFLLSLSVDL
jgi:iron complex outermembrane receptor protein